MLNRYPAWKYLMLLGVLVLGIIYALPNLYGEDPALQIAPSKGKTLNPSIVQKVEGILAQENLPFKKIEVESDHLLVRFFEDAVQIKAKEPIKEALGSGYVVALNLAPVTPKWLQFFGAKPMKLGLDLRGGVHFLLEVDLQSAVQRRLESYLGDIKSTLIKNKVRYRALRIKGEGISQALLLSFKTIEDRDQAYSLVRKNLPELEMSRQNEEGVYEILSIISPPALQELRNYTVEQTLTTLRNRVNELGVAEAVVQRQGLNHVVVELPGIQDTARAKDILGKTATLEFRLRDHENDVQKALTSRSPPGSRIYYTTDKTPVLLKKRVILTGDNITGATTGTDSRDGRPAVNIRVGGGGIGLFKKLTRENVGKQMAVVYVETKVEEKEINGQVEKVFKREESIISLATINSALGHSFQITGLSLGEAQDLSLLLRSGALPATISIVEERTVGPSLGQENIQLGVLSIQVGLGLVLLAMAFYYSFFGIIANLALVINLVLLVALLSMIGATLTLPGIAGMVLTLGMAVDANVLIFERIREELRNGMSSQAAIQSGFSRAFSTIVDANLTTLIVGVILFSVGTGPVRGFAVTLSIGILTSMFTAISGTRAMVNICYGGRNVKRLLVGI